MRDFPDVPRLGEPPGTRDALTAELRRVHAASVRYWDAWPDDAFFARPAPTVWAPADQVRHLTKSIRAVTTGLRLPRPALLLLFGWSRRPSRGLDALRATYAAALDAGGGAGRFAPRELAAHERGVAGRDRVMRQHAAAVGDACAALEGWSESWLDRCRLPHPLLGRLTVREMALFTLLHNVHHVHVAERRRIGTAPHGLPPQPTAPA